MPFGKVAGSRPAQTKPSTGAGFGAVHLPGHDMDKTLTMGQATPHSIHMAIAEHGAMRVCGVAAIAMLRAIFGPAERDMMDHLSDHLRRDIGLPPRGSPLPEAPMLPVRW